MEENKTQGFYGGESPQNKEPKCLCILVVDTSYSMSGGPIDELNKGLIAYADWVKKDTTARSRIETCIITFDSTVECVQEPALIDDISMPVLKVRGTTKLVDGVKTAISKSEHRKLWYKSNGLNYFRPFIVLITDGVPDGDQDVKGLKADIKIGGDGKHFVFMPLGVEGADMGFLQDISQKEYPAIPLDWEKFTIFFKWLSKSMASVSKSQGKDDTATFDSDYSWIKNSGWGGGNFTQDKI